MNFLDILGGTLADLKDTNSLTLKRSQSTGPAHTYSKKKVEGLCPSSGLQGEKTALLALEGDGLDAVFSSLKNKVY